MNLDVETSAVQLAVKLTIVLSGAWLAHAALSRHNPRWRVWLWRVTPVGVAGLLIAAALPPLYSLPILSPISDPLEAQADLAIATGRPAEADPGRIPVAPPVHAVPTPTELSSKGAAGMAVSLPISPALPTPSG